MIRFRHTSLANFVLLGILAAAGLASCSKSEEKAEKTPAEQPKEGKSMGETKKTEAAVFGQGCFWCAEAVYQRVPGVLKVESGYTGGTVANPTYRQVCGGDTGHAEVIRVEFDPEKVSFEKLVDVFFTTHDPTTLNRQGNDHGTQYRSAIFYESDAQKKTAEAAKEKWNKSGRFKNPIVTEITKASTFYKAEDYHQDYFNQHPDQPYCQAIIAPKVEKFEKEQSKKTDK